MVEDVGMSGVSSVRIGTVAAGLEKRRRSKKEVRKVTRIWDVPGMMSG